FMHLLETAPSVGFQPPSPAQQLGTTPLAAPGQGATGALLLEQNGAEGENSAEDEPEGNDTDEVEAVQPNGGDPISDSELKEREREILSALLLLKADGERRRVSRNKAARKADPSCKPSSYNKAIASLVKKGYVASQTGPGGGIWLSPEGVCLAKTV